MGVADINSMTRRVERLAAQLVTDLVAQRGVPRSQAEALRLARELHPEVKRLRNQVWRTYVEDLGQQMAAARLRVRPARQADYPLSATVDLVNRAVGLGEDENTAVAEFLDPVTKEVVRRRVSPYLVADEAAGMTQVVAGRISASVARHAHAAGRAMVADTAMVGEVIDAGGRPRRAGFARVLTGAESCGFCTMLASRGPVYKEDTALRRKDGRSYHDNCDCVSRLVVDGRPWEGQAEADALYSRWKSVAYDGGTLAPDALSRWAKHVRKMSPAALKKFSPIA